MSKKSKIIKKIKKATKPLKSKPASKKANKEKLVKAKPLKKTVIKKLDKKIVKKKTNEKKVVKPVKKLIVKKVASKPKHTASKKVTKLAKPAKPVKKEVAKKIVVSKPAPAIKSNEVKKQVVVAKEKKETTTVAAKPSFNPPPVRKGNPMGDFKQRPKRRKGGRKRKNKGDDDEPEIMHDELVEQLLRSTKKLRQLPKKPKMLKTFTNPMASLTVAPPATTDKKSVAAPKKEPKGKFVLEYLINSNVAILYEFLTSPSGLMEWFADVVSIHDGIFTFVWDGSEQKAKLISFKNNEYIRLQWFDKPEGTYFEFRIQVDKITSDLSLLITDFADEASDLETSKRLWDTQIDKLLHVIGSY